MSHAPAPATSKTVGIESLLLQVVENDRQLVHDLMNGTEAMRDAGELWLPKEEGETRGDYENRLARSVLYNGFKKAVRNLVGKPFRKPIVYVDAEQFEEIIQDADLKGNHLDIIGRDLLEDIVSDGIGFLLIDYPPVENPEQTTLATEKEYNLRPYYCVIDCRNVIGWRVEKINGKDTLTQLRLREWVIEPDGDFSEVEVEQIRVIERDRWMVYRLALPDDKKATPLKGVDENEKSSEWELQTSGVNTLGKIPLVVMYGPEKIGELLARPALMDLAFLNVAHWQSDSDQRNILHYARVPILFASGFPDPDIDGGEKIVLSGNKFIQVTSADASLEWVEHSGAAIGAGAQDIQALENRMMVAGAEPLVKKAATTATQRVLDGMDQDCDLAAMCRALQDGLEQSFRFVADWTKAKITKEPSVKINTDFGIDLQAATDLQILLNAVNSNKISQETFLKELKRRNVLEYDTDIEEEIGKIEGDVSAAMANQREMLDAEAGAAAGAAEEDIPQA